MSHLPGTSSRRQRHGRSAHSPRHRCGWLVAALLAVSALAAPASAQPPRQQVPVDVEVRADAFSARELAADARRVAVGGKLAVSGLEIVPGAGPEILELERVQVYAPEARVVDHGKDGEAPLELPDTLRFRGHVGGQAGSLALLTVRPSGEVRGMVQQRGRMFLLHEKGAGARATVPGLADDPSAGEPQPLVSVAVEELGEEPEPFACGNDELGLDAASPGGAFPATAAGLEAFTAEATAVTASLTTTPYTAQVAIETDYELYQTFGGDADDLIDYVGDLIAYTSAIYDAEIDTDLQISHLSVWSAANDPWEQTSSHCAMYEFGKYWNDNRGGVDRTLAHFISGKNTNSGVAWVGVLCQGAFNYTISCPNMASSGNYGGAYGFSGGIDGNFNPATGTPVWDIVAVSHEIGHNFNSSHTHCYNGVGGSSQPVDTCYNGEAYRGCYSGTASLPSGCPGPGNQCGTIMSYCHLLSGGMGNIDLTLGTSADYGTLPQRVPDRMRAHVESRAACMPRIAACTQDLSLTSGTDNGTETYEVCGTITAGGNYSVGNSGNVTFTAGRVVLTDGFHVDQNGVFRADG